MLELIGRTFKLCDGLSRRSVLKVGSLGLAGLTLPDVLACRQAQAASERRDTSVILFWMAGGPSHIDTYDLKPDAAEEIRGPFRPIETNVPGLSVCDLLPRHAKLADRLAVIRSLHHALADHDDGSHWMQTGYPLLGARQRGQQQPAQGAVVSRLRGANQPGLPPYVCIPEDYRSHMGFYQAATYLGPRHNALNGGGDPKLGNYRLPEFALQAEMTDARLQGRRELMQAVDRLSASADRRIADMSTAAMSAVQQQAFDLVLGAKARAAFDLSQEPDALRERYGRHAWGQGALLARRLVEAGVTFVTINLYEKDVDWWDDHFTLEKNLRKRLPVYDAAMCGLLEDLHERGLSDNVLVVACGEFGRWPRIDKNAGRSHWPRAMSAVMSGGGIRGGQIIGRTTTDGGEPADRPLVPGDLLASIYRVLGIDHEQFLRDRQYRPIRLVEHGQPIQELFG